MFAQRSNELQVQVIASGIRYALPPRNLGKTRWVGLLPIAVGLVPATAALAMLIDTLVSAANGQLAHGIMQVVTALAVALVMTLFALATTAFGLAILRGRCRIDVRDGYLRLTEIAGPFRWSWSRPIDALRSLEIHCDATRVNGEPVTSGPWSDIAYIKAEFEAHKTLALAILYPCLIVTDLAETLAERTTHKVRVTFASPDSNQPNPPQRQPGDPPAKPRKPRRATIQPTTSRAILEPNNHGLTLRIPPIGFWKERMGLGKFGVAWCAFTAVVTCFLVMGRAPLGAWLIIAAFWAVGLAMLLAGLNMAKRSAIVDVVADTLVITRSNLFGTKQSEWIADDLSAIRVGPSGMESNDVPILELQILPHDKPKAGFFAGRDNAELRWIATTLCDALRLPTAN